MSPFFQKIAEISPYLLFGMLIALVLALGVSVYVLLRMIQLDRRMKVFMAGPNASSLEDIVRKIMDDNQKIKIQQKNNQNLLKEINENLATAYRKIGIVKFNAFPGMAGKMSYSICLLNNENNGYILNAIHNQDGCYSYVKEIMNGKSINPLTKEDEEALKDALEMQI